MKTDTGKVALRKESVDRNFSSGLSCADKVSSLSARRAWIEIASRRRVSGRALVALRKESVDRNVNLRVVDGSKSVALRKESVDRNFLGMNIILSTTGRSPQGERG